MDDHKILGIKNENRMEKFQKMKKKQIICNSSGAWEINTICKYET